MTVIEANGLLAADKNGLSDPYVVVKFRKHKEKTKTRRRTLKPVWESGVGELIYFKLKNEDDDKKHRNNWTVTLTVHDDDPLGNVADNYNLSYRCNQRIMDLRKRRV